MDNTILLSIIIPHHNTPDLLIRLIDSIPRREGVEIIVVDDNSDKDKKASIQRSDVQTIYIDKEHTKGAGRARNVALEKARGKWLLFADSDDFFIKGFLDVVASYFDSEYDMVMFKADSVDTVTLEPSDRNQNINRQIDYYLSGELSAKEASLAVQSPWCRLIRHNVVRENNIWFDETKACNDTMFTTKVGCLAKTIAICDKVIYVVTYRQGSLWDSRMKDPQNYLTRLEVKIRRNEFVHVYGYKRLPILGYVLRAYHVSPLTFIKALFISLRKGALFHGFSSYFVH